MNVEIVTNKKALTTVRNKKKELKDLDNHAWESNNETGSNVMDALDSVNELETNLDQSKESMYKLSYVIRVAADSLDELKRRCDEVKDFYDDLNVKLVRHSGICWDCMESFFQPANVISMIISSMSLLTSRWTWLRCDTAAWGNGRYLYRL